MKKMNSLSNLLSIIIAPGVLVSAVMALLNVGERNNVQSNDIRREQIIHPIMSEPPPSKTTVRLLMPNETSKKLQTIDKDIAFVAGESEMPLSVYESPLMNSYRQFKKTKKNLNSDGYYVVNKQKITNNSNVKQNEIVLLYGRGPVFQKKDEYSDRFEGFDD